MRSLPTAVTTELVADAHGQIATCVEVRLATPIYRTTRASAITFDGDTYTPDVFRFGEVGGALLPVSPTMTLSFQNIRDPVTDDERHWSALLEGEDINGVEVDVRVLFLEELADTTAQVAEARWVASGAILRGNMVEIQVGPITDIGRAQVPEPSLRSPRCRWEYGDGNCRSVSGHDSCPTKDVVACVARHPETRLRFSQWAFDTDLRRYADGS